MELLSEKWQAVAVRPGVQLVRIHAEENEKDMVDSFYSYMLGVDTPNPDVPVIFESIYHDDDQYSLSLLTELKNLIHIWNTANKDALSVQVEPIRWEPDFALINKNNPAFLFIENMNLLTAYLSLAQGIFFVGILKVSFVQPARFRFWLEKALELPMHKQIRILLHDTVKQPFYDALAGKYPDKVITLYPELDMDSAMQQVAAMGNPHDPAVQYRQAFVLLMQAIEKRKEDEAKKHGDVCIDIAISNMEKSPYWIGQVIAVYAALANDQVGHKNYKKAIDYSNEGVIAAEQAIQMINDEFIYRKFLGQALMLRASLYTVDNNWEKAIEDFAIAADHYQFTNDIVLAMEALRMEGYCNRMYGNIHAACAALAKAVETSKQLPAHIIRSTTFAGVIELLIQINDQKHISSADVEAAPEQVYGKEWMKEILNWKYPSYEHVTDASKTIATQG